MVKKIKKYKFMSMSRINSKIIEMIACLWIILTLSSVAMSQPNFYTHGRYGKREETAHTSLDPSTFFSGSRYGRGDSEFKNSNLDEKSVELLPRVDRFFLGSRYGKRKMYPDVSDKRFASLKNIEAALKYNDHMGHQKSISNSLNQADYRNRDENKSHLLLKSMKIMNYPNLKRLEEK
ncbi:uncharacterized protein RYa isoform X2 [Chelonus insularis]|nr:uncharacterized protein LOC118074495 isoform X2 [Chelonus insularis]XP_034951628.1 uncharacterized protein LOC118074495 isoform X2 [Chelonus insularis]